MARFYLILIAMLAGSCIATASPPCPGGQCPLQRPGIVIPKQMPGPAVTVLAAPVATSNRTVVRHRSGVRVARPRIFGWR